MSTTLDATELALAGAARQASLVASGALSAREMTELHLERIGRLGPQLNAFRVVLAEQALGQADAADARRARGDGGALNGVPVAIKDDTDVAGQATPFGTAGNGGLKGEDSAIVARLRDAGAVIIAKTHVPELMICCFTETLTFGATRNPWDPNRTPGGSSGGSGAAVAAGLCGVAHGTDGAGSIRIPAAWCGVFGLKPQRDRVPLAPYDDAWYGLNTHGPIARAVADAALFLDAAADTGTTFAAAAARPPGPLRIALATNLPAGVLARPSADALRAVHETADLLRALGHTVTETALDFGPVAGPSVIARYLAGIARGLQALPHPERVEPRTKGFARLGAAIPRALVEKAVAAGAGIAARVGRTFEQADVILTPGPTKPPFEIGALHGRGALWTLNAMLDRVPYYAAYNATGQPAASVPAGFDGDGLPLAVQLVGRADDEATLLSLAAQLEQARPWAQRRPAVS
jgi:amidase